MSVGKTLLASLLGTAASTSAAAAVASGAAGIEPQTSAEGTAELERLVAAAHEEGTREGMVAGRAAERARFGAVLTGANVEGRLGLAITMLSTTDNTAEQIDACLASVTPAPAQAATPPAPAPSAPAPGQAAVVDPIAANTGLVETGAAGANAALAGGDGQPDVAAIDALWAPAIAQAGGGVTAGGVWDGLTTQRPQ